MSRYALGMSGYEYFENLPWRDAFLNAAMLMGGMGPVDAPRTNGGKVFAGLYALYAGLVFLAAAALVCANTASSAAQVPLGERSVDLQCQLNTRLTLRCSRPATGGFASLRRRAELKR